MNCIFDDALTWANAVTVLGLGKEYAAVWPNMNQMRDSDTAFHSYLATKLKKLHFQDEA